MTKTGPFDSVFDYTYKNVNGVRYSVGGGPQYATVTDFNYNLTSSTGSLDWVKFTPDSTIQDFSGTLVSSSPFIGLDFDTSKIPAGMTRQLDLYFQENYSLPTEIGPTNPGVVYVSDHGSLTVNSHYIVTGTKDVNVIASLGGTTNITEGDTISRQATYTVYLDNAATSPITITYSTSDGTAQAGSDYTATSGSVIIPKGQTQAKFTVDVLPDTNPENDETFSVHIDGASAGASLDPTHSSLITTITDGSLPAEADAPLAQVVTVLDNTISLAKFLGGLEGGITEVAQDLNKLESLVGNKVAALGFAISAATPLVQYHNELSAAAKISDLNSRAQSEYIAARNLDVNIGNESLKTLFVTLGTSYLTQYAAAQATATGIEAYLVGFGAAAGLSVSAPILIAAGAAIVGGVALSLVYDQYYSTDVKQLLSVNYEVNVPAPTGQTTPPTQHVLHGYVSGSTVFADSNSNGALDPGEVSTTTNGTGGFTLTIGTDQIVAIGGTDISTGLPINAIMKAPSGSQVISPLTTLVADVGVSNTAKILANLGLQTSANVTTLDFVAAAKSGDPSAYLAAVKVYDAAVLVGAVGGGTPADGFAAIETLLSNATSPVNLGDPATIATLLASRPGLDAATATKLATAIAGTIGSIDTAAQGKSGDALITAASAVERVAEGVMTSALAAAGTSLTALATAADSYTGQHLTDAITLAATQLPGSTSGSGGTGSGGAGSGGAGGSVGGGSGGSGSTGDLPTAGVGSGTSGDPGTGGSNLPSLSTLVHDTTAPAGQAYALYHGLLGRAPDTAGLQALTTALANGTSPHDAAQALLASPEGQSHLSAADNAGFVAQLYQSVLGRAPDSAGLANATAALDHGLSRADLADSLVFSPEHLGQLQSAFTAGISVPDPHAVSVAQAYYSLLGRAPDASGLQAFGNASLHDVAEGLMHSTEYASLTGMTSDTAYIAELYQHLLGRAADSTGAQTWTAALSAGTDRAGVANALLDSAEFQGHYAGQSSAAYVEALYEHVLGRPGDTAGVQTWANALDHGASRTDVAHAFTASSEFQAQAGGQSDAAFVEGLYAHALGRSADAAGEQAWLSALSHGASRADVLVGLMQSAEGQAHLTAQIAHDWHLT